MVPADFTPIVTSTIGTVKDSLVAFLPHLLPFLVVLGIFLVIWRAIARRVSA